MNRRSFFKTALGAVAAVVAAPVLKLLPKVVTPAKLARQAGPSAAELEFWRNRKQPGFNFYDLQANVQPLYKEFGIERGVKFTVVPAGEGFADDVANEDMAGLLAWSYGATPKQLERAAQWSGADQAHWKAMRNA